MTEVASILVDLLTEQGDLRSLTQLYLSSNYQRTLIDQKVPLLAKNFGIDINPTSLMELVDEYVLHEAEKLPYYNALTLAVEWDNENAVAIITEYLTSDHDDNVVPPFKTYPDQGYHFIDYINLVNKAIETQSYHALQGFDPGLLNIAGSDESTGYIFLTDLQKKRSNFKT